MQVLEAERHTHLYLCRVRLRRGEGWHVKPRAENMDGLTAWFYAAWNITDEDSGIYAGEVAMCTEPGLSVRIPGWVASGDLELIEKRRTETVWKGPYGDASPFIFESDSHRTYRNRVYTLEEILAELEQ